MKQVYKCDHCSKTDLKPQPILEHEVTCSFNPKTKYCFTCKYTWDSGFDYSIPECKLNLDTVKGMDEGNCKGWVDENLEDEI